MKIPITLLLENLINPRSDLQQSIASLIDLGEEALPCLIGALEMEKYVLVRPMILQIIQEIGSRAPIDDVIPLLLRFLKDANKPIYRPAFYLLLQMGDKVIYNAHDILAYFWSDDSWVQNTCSLLKEMNVEHLDFLASELLHLFAIGNEKNCLDESVIGLLRKIGSPKANGVLPLLRDKLIVRDRKDFRQESIEALQDFDLSAVKLLIPTLQKCLLDESEFIRSSAKKVLALLED